MTSTPTRNNKRQWLIAAGLVLLTLVPMAGGAVRIAQLAGGAEVTQENARFFAAPIPVLTHIFSATVFCLLGAFQFVPWLRQHRRNWHRLAGRLSVVLGLIAALSGLWMSALYPDAPGDGLPLRVIRLGFGGLMVAAIMLAFVAIRRRDVTTHRMWMMRGYAIGMGAGTQVFTHVPWILLVGIPTGNIRAMLMAAGWVINLAVAECAMRTRHAPRGRTTNRPSTPAAASLSSGDA